MAFDFARSLQKIQHSDPLRIYGRIDKIVGLAVESQGPPASMGDMLLLEDHPAKVPLQVVGFSGNKTISMPLGDLTGMYPGQRLYSSGAPPGFKISEGILGRVINGLGQPLDSFPDFARRDYLNIYASPPNAMQREPINSVLSTGIKAIDSMITIGRGQRMGIFSGSGVGKSTLMGMIARNTAADISVIALVGERGRELKDFITNSLGPEGLARSVLVVSTSEEPPLRKIISAFTATAIAEYYSRRGANVLLMMDSVTRLAMAQREVGLSAGEPPSTKGYTPSVFNMMPRLMERAGNFIGQGSITAIYTILVEGDDVTEPVSDHARSILDGHVVLSRDLANSGFFPAIDVLGSISRLMNEVVSADHKKIAREIRSVLAVYREAEDLINIGAYVKGSNPRIDDALARIDGIRSFLRQEVGERFSYEQALALLGGI